MKRTTSVFGLTLLAAFVIIVTGTTVYAADPLSEAAGDLQHAVDRANGILTIGGRVLNIAVILNVVAGGLGILTAGIAPLPDSRAKKAVAIATGIVVGFVTIVSNTIFGIDIRSTTNKINTLANYVADADEFLKRRLPASPPTAEITGLLQLVQGSFTPVAKGTEDVQAAINGSFAYFWLRSRPSLMIVPFAILHAQQNAAPQAQQAYSPNLQFVGEGTGATLAEAASRAEADAYRKVGDYLRGELTKRTARPISETWLKKYVRTIATVERSQIAPGQAPRVTTSVRISRLSAIVASAEVPSSTVVDVQEKKIKAAVIEKTQLCVYVGDIHNVGERTRVAIYEPKPGAPCATDSKDVSEKVIDRRLVGAKVLLDRPMTKGDEVPLRDGSSLVVVLDVKYEHDGPDQHMKIEIMRLPPRSSA